MQMSYCMLSYRKTNVTRCKVPFSVIVKPIKDVMISTAKLKISAPKACLCYFVVTKECHFSLTAQFPQSKSGLVETLEKK